MIHFIQTRFHSLGLAFAMLSAAMLPTMATAQSQANQPPQLLAKRLSDAVEGRLYRQQIQVHDADGDALVFRLAKNSQQAGPMIAGNGELVWQHGAQLSLTAGGLIQWTPSFHDAALHRIDIVVTDGSVDVPMIIEILVHDVNRAPSFNTDIPLSALENQSYQYPINIFDIDGDKLALDLIALPEGMRFKNNSLVWTPSYQQAGQHKISFSLSDGKNRIGHSFMLEVANTNQAPVFVSQAPHTVNEGESYQYHIEVLDKDQQSMVLRLLDAPPGMQLNGNVLSWKTDFSSQGKHRIVLALNDGETETQQAFDLDVLHINQLPLLADINNATATAYESMPYYYQIAASDLDNQQLRYQLIHAPEGMTVNGEGLIHWVPNYKQQGQHRINIAIDDGENTLDFSFEVLVSDANLAPIIEPINDAELFLGDVFTEKLIALDPDGDKVYYQLIYGPVAMTINKKGKLNWNTSGVEAGKFTVIVSASDGDLKHRRHFVIDVKMKE